MGADHSDVNERHTIPLDSHSDDVREDASGRDEAMLFCPNCSVRLFSLKCKLICKQCGYYMSCVDYY
jgi:hypothetical protein